jgi:hypothetical protein
VTASSEIPQLSKKKADQLLARWAGAVLYHTKRQGSKYMHCTHPYQCTDDMHAFEEDTRVGAKLSRCAGTHDRVDPGICSGTDGGLRFNENYPASRNGGNISNTQTNNRNKKENKQTFVINPMGNINIPSPEYSRLTLIFNYLLTGF